MKPTEEMQDIVVNGVTKAKACAAHDIDDHVTTIEINVKKAKKK